jgi:hypothetical protein
MNTKVCLKCGVEKIINEFNLIKSSGNYLNKCKSCIKKERIEYYLINPEKLKETKKREYLNNIEKYKIRNKENQDKNSLEYKIKKKEYYKNNEETFKIKQKIYYENNKEKILERCSNYVNRNFEKTKEYQKKYRENNRENVNEYKRKYNKFRYDTDPIFKLRRCIRHRVNEFLKSKNFSKKNKTFDIVGCSPDELKIYIEKQFTEGMNWDNYGFYGWHVDHKVPLSNSKTEEETYKLCHYSNLQPMWWNENLSKGKKIL